MPNLRAAWRLYSTFVVTGFLVGTATYGIASLGDQGQFVTFVALTLPLILAFCLALSVPLAGSALLAIRFLEWRFGSQPIHWWRLVGGLLGFALVASALASFLSVGALANDAGKLFWLTFLVAGTIAGIRAGSLVPTLSAHEKHPKAA